MTDEELIRQFASAGDHNAFADVVYRHIDSVYSMALRLTGGDHAASDDISQAVFVLLSRKCKSLGSSLVLQRWLFVATRLCHRGWKRQEDRRRIREQRSAQMRSEAVVQETPPWQSIAPLLDELVAKLGQSDRDAVRMRFYLGMTYSQIGLAMHISEDAARKRLERAVDRLRGMFERHGIHCAAGGLAAAMTSNTTHAAPIEFAGQTALLTQSPIPGPQMAKIDRIIRSAASIQLQSTLITLALWLIGTIAVAITILTASSTDWSVRPTILPTAPVNASVPGVPVAPPAGITQPGSRIAALSSGIRGARPPSAPPGDPISFDFRSVSRGLPLEVASVRIVFSTNARPTSARMQLPSGEVLTVPMLSPTSTVFEWYNPAYIDPKLLDRMPHAVLTQGLSREINDDGILDATFWIDGSPVAGSYYQLSVVVEAWDAPLAATTRSN